MATEAERSIELIEQHMAALGEALREQQPDAVAAAAAQLQRALGVAEPLRRGALPPHLQQRVALAVGRVAAQRESLARAGAAVGRAIDVLLPGAAPRGAYSPAGLPQRAQGGGVLRA